MPIAKCEKCGEEVRWHNYRGARLKDIPCSKCGGRLRPWGYGKTKTPRARLKDEEWDRAILKLLKTPLTVYELEEQLGKIPKFERRFCSFGHLMRLVGAGKVEERDGEKPHTIVYQTREGAG